MQRFARLAMVLVASSLLAGACGGGKGVGGGLKANGGTAGGEGAIGQATTTTAAAAPTTAAAARPTTTAKSAVTAAPVTPCHIVYINNDDKGRYFEPADNPQENQIDCTVGRVVRFVNHDDDSRRPFHTLHSDPAAAQFSSPQIPQNGSWDAKVTQRGTFSVKDDQRPYAELVVRVI